MYTKDQKDKAMKTYRSRGAIGKNAQVPKYLYENFLSSCRNSKTDWHILDYGCGKEQLHVKFFQSQGFNQILGYDFSIPNSKEFLRIDSFDIIYASNVLNVQDSCAMMEETLSEIVNLLKSGGLFIANYPMSPRKSNLNLIEVQMLLSKFFTHNTCHFNKGTKQSGIFICRK
jgi:SAM-dependent methyltransferase